MASQHIPRSLDVRPDWLAQHAEPALEPDLPIIDAHHHLYETKKLRYLFDELRADVDSGHNIRATVFIQSARSMHRQGADAAMAPVGEVEFANGVAAMSASGAYGSARLCAGIVGSADLALGTEVMRTLEAMTRVTGERFRGIRDSLTWDDTGQLNGEAAGGRQGRMQSRQFREGFACLAALGLSFEAWVYHPQLDELAGFLRTVPDMPVVLNHLGGPLHIGPYAGRRDEIFATWSAAMHRLAANPNVYVKLGGIGMNYGGFGFHENAVPPSSQMLCDAWRPYVETCIEIFGTPRCMFESNFPVDKGTAQYATIWNAFKRMVSGASTSEKTDLFWKTAADAYGLGSL